MICDPAPVILGLVLSAPDPINVGPLTRGTLTLTLTLTSRFLQIPHPLPHFPTQWSASEFCPIAIPPCGITIHLHAEVHIIVFYELHSRT